MIPISDVRKVSGGSPKNTPVKSKAKGLGVFGDDSPAAAMAANLLEDAAKADATAIHIEPYADVVHVRYRIDGLLHEGKALPREALKNLIKRFKKLAHLSVSEVRLPQDGRFETVQKGATFIVRVNVLPVADGEKLVLHLSRQSGISHDLEKLGFWGQALQDLQEAATTPRGLILVGGPVGSGKSATLYALLGLAAKPTLSAATVEDTIQHKLAGVIQTPVNERARMSVASTLRAVLRQDPNIVMVSEIREPDTANQVAHAALGGHLLLAGVSSRDIAASVDQLVAMGVEPYALTTATRLIANQRLVRRLCQQCRLVYKPPSSEFGALCKALGLAAEEAKVHITNLQSIAASDLGVEPATLGGSTLPLWRANPTGCDHCGGRGYKGRIALAEVLVVSAAVQKLIFSKATGRALYDQAMQDGMVPLPLDGLVKVVLGLTSTEEVAISLQR